MKKVLSIVGLSLVVIGLLAVGSLLPVWKVAAENLAAFDGSIYTPLKTISLNNLNSTVGGNLTNFLSGGLLTMPMGLQTAQSAPAAGSQATASVAAIANARHVLDCVSVSATSTGAVTATTLLLSLRDGASGAGNQTWVWTIAIPTAAAANIQEVGPFHFCSFGFVGTTSTAMTAEFSAGVANLAEAISFSFHNVQ